MSTTTIDAPSPAVKPATDNSRLGTGAYQWKVSETHVDLSMPPPPPVPAMITA